MDNDWKKRLGVVYSTNPEFSFNRDDQVEGNTLPPDKQNLKVRPEKKGRKGKTVTLVTGFSGNDKDIEELARLLKTRCGTGGSAKDGEIIIQGDFTARVITILSELNYKVKRSGG
ncbi:MAG: translation initiation factor [Bacteroidales bacterium]|nr:translation initiation factor [Bacteroidales bacterium]